MSKSQTHFPAPATPVAGAVLSIQLLGDFRLSFGDQLLVAVNTPRLEALLAYLVLHRDAPQSRKHLAFLFWPDTNEGQALANLRNLLHKLRQALPDPDCFFGADAHVVYWRLDAPYTLDVAEFDLLAASTMRADLERAANLYRGDLLPGCYDDWIMPERTRLQQMVMAALERLIGLLEERRESRVAISYAERLRQIDPLNEATCRTLMRLHAADNDRAGALRVYHTCVRTLQNELAVDPAPETRDLYQRLLSTAAVTVTPAGSVGHQPPLVGRQREWKTLRDAWHAASSGIPACVILTGEAGIGKTRLGEELLASTNRQGYASAGARCYPAEGTLAYAPVATWLRSPALRSRLLSLEPAWLTEVARLLPELLTERRDLPQPGQLTEGWQRKRLFEALARAILRQEKALLLFLDDLQWCDRDTLEWLGFLLHFDPRARLLVVATLRAEELSGDHPSTALLSALRRAGQLSELALGPLSADETASLAAHMVEQALTPQQRARLYQETEGNPLFVVEMARYGLDAGDQVTETPDQPALQRPSVPNPPPLPPKIHAVLHARLAQLSPEARELAGLAATVGREFTFSVLASASDQSGDALVRSLDELWQARIVREQGVAGYDFSHGKLREVAYASQSAARRRLQHRRVAQALEAVHGTALDAVSGQIATHYELAGMFERAVPYYQRAADAARQLYANPDAIHYYRRALALLEGPAPPSPALAAELHERLGDTLYWTARYDEARAAFQQAVAAMPASESVSQAELHRKIGNSWRDEYRYPEALLAYADAERALGALPSEPSPEWWQAWIQVLLEISLVYYWLGQVSESDRLRVRLQPAVEQHGTPGQRAVYFQNIGMNEFRRNHSVATAETVALIKAALAAQQETGNRAGIPAAQFMVGFALLWSGDPQTAMEPLQTALHQAEQTGDVSLQARSLTYLTVAHRQCMQVEETRRYAARSLEVATAAHMPEYVATAKANQAWLTWHAGDLIQAQELGRAALELWHQLPVGHASTPFQWLALWPLIAVALHDGELSVAVEHGRGLLDPAQQQLPDALSASLEQVTHAWDSGTPETTRAMLYQALALAQQMRYL